MENVAVTTEQAVSAEKSGSLLHFLDNADVVIWAIVLMLLAMSIISWTIMIHKWWTLRKVVSESKTFEDYIWAQKDIKNAIPPGANAVEHSAGRVFLMAQHELPERWTKDETPALLSRVDRAMSGVMGRDMEVYRKHLVFLASVGSTSPFIGLLGTVWGIMNSFSAIAVTQNTSLAVVAPGIAEALFVTALGLFAAIPASFGYNKFSTDINRYARRIELFMEDILLNIERGGQ